MYAYGVTLYTFVWNTLRPNWIRALQFTFSALAPLPLLAVGTRWLEPQIGWRTRVLTRLDFDPSSTSSTTKTGTTMAHAAVTSSNSRHSKFYKDRTRATTLFGDDWWCRWFTSFTYVMLLFGKSCFCLIFVHVKSYFYVYFGMVHSIFCIATSL